MIVLPQPCPREGFGRVAFVLCSDQHTLVLTCTECEAVWLDPAHVDREYAVDPVRPGFVIPDLGVSIAMPPSRWATPDEVIAYGWADYLPAYYRSRRGDQEP